MDLSWQALRDVQTVDFLKNPRQKLISKQAIVFMKQELAHTAGKRRVWIQQTAGPSELLKTEKPIKVKANESLSLVIKYKQQPNERDMVQIQNKNEVDVPLKKNKMKAPSERGTYYYSYSVWWMDESQKNVSNGDASYAFVLEVK